MWQTVNSQIQLLNQGLWLLPGQSLPKETVDVYYQELGSNLDKYNLQDKLHLIYNLDETGLYPKHRPTAIIVSKSTKPKAHRQEALPSY